MGKAITSIGRSVGNGLAGVPRTLGAWGIAILDTLRGAGNIFTDIGQITRNTGDQLKEVLLSSRNTGKRYNKLVQVPAGVGIGIGMLWEAVVRATLNPIKNAFLNVRDIAGNFFKNIGNTIGRIFDSKKPVSDFSFEHLKTKEPSKNNRISKLARRRKKKKSDSN